MGGGNGQKAKMARERNLEKQKGAKGSQLESNKKAMSIQVDRFVAYLMLIFVLLTCFFLEKKLSAFVLWILLENLWLLELLFHTC
ncbi:hypothetical protein HHK36_002702 [Tetracentron sinense]|uniref:Small EDRK-rich factor-like N-terminal domain-containing protein n=1 Tax=Tetracentron sinense TaxID=13715 RepID=A0A834ZMN1_TETSI|nr:hypothetical protein HHK36_002702 [Tetracentron sinense]